ncbi:Lrp/AsnC family transcriptional regulator for asnA, asnC and gidA [Evansella vedderi]|uniref:Lrp/AsnC family transcriptional regulator for asnA, asnC and gidA n=1 Tax=Evansella vedderi TaxID=38282 RepID=A0ABT9ZP08_9BACI|nr:Lrp/AsnC family transcriptional regulator [Evansella vedderi]MDQ0252934.1 Lrp/AsnC family transcriptional regulator for asnA, asnC and gidA [Evansella vedderi]
MTEDFTGIDDIDLQIISHLQKDGRKTFKDIANEIGVAERTIRTRVANLRENGTLQIVGIVNPIKVGLKLMAIIHLSVEQYKLDTCVEQLHALDEVRFIAMTSGKYELMIEVCTRSHEELGDFLSDKLQKVEGIRERDVVMELKILKNEFRFMKDK